MKVKARVLGREKVMAKLRELVPEAEKELAKAQMEVAHELANRIRSRAPGSGRYRATIQADLLANRPTAKAIKGSAARKTKDPNATGIFADYIWRFLEFGTQAHVISPKKGEYLVFRGPDGRWVYTKQVKHPGTVAHPHIYPTYRAYKKKLRRKMANAVNKAVRKAKKK